MGKINFGADSVPETLEKDTIVIVDGVTYVGNSSNEPVEYSSNDVSDISGASWVLDEDDFTSDSSTKLPTQQSTKKYVDDKASLYTEKQSISKNNVTSGGPDVDRPFVCLTFDDGYTDDYDVIAPLLESKGVRGTFFVHSDIDGRITDDQIKELYNKGHAFGSHTKRHTILSALAVVEDVNIGDNTIIILNGSSSPYLNVPDGGEIKLYVSSDPSKIFTVTNVSDVSGGQIVCTLSEPSEWAITSNFEVYLHEDNIEEEILGPKQRLESIGVECVGFAYPWGSGTALAQGVIAGHFAYARNATGYGGASNPAEDFAGRIDGDNIHFDQLQVPTTELINLSDTEINNVLDDIESNNSVLSVLGHAYSGTSLTNALTSLIDKCDARGIEILTLDEAIKYYGYKYASNKFRIDRSGLPYGAGFSSLPRGSAVIDSRLDVFPFGWSAMRIESTDDNTGFPSSAGTLLTYRRAQGSSPYWSFQYFHDINSNNIYYRNSTGWATYTEWTNISQDFQTGNDGGYTPLSNGEFTVTNQHHRIDGEGGSADDLVTINSSASVGTVIYLRIHSSARPITIKHETGNIILKGGADLLIDDMDTIVMLMLDAGDTWKQI